MIELCHDNKRFQSVKLCECGCGQPTLLAIRNNRCAGQETGVPLTFLRGHARDNPGRIEISQMKMAELYQKGMSTAEIAEYNRNLGGRGGSSVIRKRLIDYGIELRDTSHALKVKWRSDPCLRAKYLAGLKLAVEAARNADKSKAVTALRAYMNTESKRQRAIRIRKKGITDRRGVFVDCAREGCGRSIWRMPSRIQSRNFCSHSCAAQDLNRRRKLAAIAAPIAVEQPLIALPGWAQEIMEKRAARESADSSA